jgi:hypothetical protein
LIPVSIEELYNEKATRYKQKLPRMALLGRAEAKMIYILRYSGTIEREVRGRIFFEVLEGVEKDRGGFMARIAVWVLVGLAVICAYFGVSEIVISTTAVNYEALRAASLFEESGYSAVTDLGILRGLLLNRGLIFLGIAVAFLLAAILWRQMRKNDAKIQAVIELLEKSQNV